MLRKSDTGEYPVSLEDFEARFPDVSFPSDVNSIDFASFGYDIVWEATAPSGDRIHTVAEGAPEFNSDDSKWYQTWVVTDITVGMTSDQLATLSATIRTEMYTAIANTRLELQNYGTTNGGVFVPTDQSSIIQAFTLLDGFELNSSASISIKGPDGTWATVTAESQQTLCTTIFNFLASCYNYEKTLYDTIINTGLPQDLIVIDIDSGWPS